MEGGKEKERGISFGVKTPKSTGSWNLIFNTWAFWRWGGVSRYKL